MRSARRHSMELHQYEGDGQKRQLIPYPPVDALQPAALTLAANIDDSEMMSDSHQNVNQQLEAISGRLACLLDQLAERREQSTTRAERKHLDRLRGDAKKQVSAIIKLQTSVHDANTVIAKSSHALGAPAADSGRASRQSLASDVDRMLFRAVAGPFQNQHRLRLVRHRRSLELSQLLKPWKQTRSHTRANACERQSGMTTAATSTTTLEQSLSTRSNACGNPETEHAGPGPKVEVHAEDDTPNPSMPSQEVSDLDSDSDPDQDPHSRSPSTSSSSSLSPSLQDQDQDQDWSPGHAAPLPPPLPRKSSRRISYTPRVPSPSLMPPLPPLPLSLSPLPLMPRTPPPLVPESESAAESFSSSSSAASVITTADNIAEDILSGLEKRYGLTMTTVVTTAMTPPSTP